MILSTKQESGLRIALQRYKNKEKLTVIGGYAGSGKSTLVRFIIEAFNVPEKDVCFATFTGKAAQVLLKKGNKNVSTLHKLLYKSFPRPDGTYGHIPVDDIPYKIVVVDEVSMAPKTLMQLLAKYNVHVLCLGDPFQLPPVDKNEDNHLLDNPHIFLDEIMRQAQESEIIRLTMDIREEKLILPSKGNEVIVAEHNKLNTGMLKWADQVLCATNATRIALNRQMRKLRGIESDEPQDGDKIICLRNYWEVLADNNNPLINGTIGYLENCFSTFFKLPGFVGGQTLPILNATMKVMDDDSRFFSLDMDKGLILTGENTLDWKTSFRLAKSEKTRHLVPMEFTYGYAITGHKSQGSEWDQVLVCEEGFPYQRTEHARWLYTCCTRAAEKLVLVKK